MQTNVEKMWKPTVAGILDIVIGAGGLVECTPLALSKDEFE